MSTALSMVLPKNRVELFFKDAQDLRERIRFLKSHGIISFNIVNKNQKDTVNKWVQCIREEYPEANICAHYSLKYNKVARKGVEAHKECLKSFADKCQADEILVISGSGKKTAWNTIEGLKAISGEKVAVAYNPYFPEDSDQIAENSRLEQKLSSCDRVHKIYLQFGTDLNRLKEALEMISANGNLLICGSLFLPTAKLIAQQKFRPWNGVFLGKEFLVGPDNARSVVVEMIKLYRKYDVEILWEAPGIRTDKDIALMFELLEASIDGDKKESDQNEETSSETTSNKRRKLKLAMEPKPGIVLFGSHDVRLRDNRALETAARHHETIVPVFLWTKQNTWGVTGALEVVLKEALRSLESSLKKFGLVF